MKVDESCIEEKQLLLGTTFIMHFIMIPGKTKTTPQYQTKKLRTAQISENVDSSENSFAGVILRGSRWRNVLCWMQKVAVQSKLGRSCFETFFQGLTLMLNSQDQNEYVCTWYSPKHRYGLIQQKPVGVPSLLKPIYPLIHHELIDSWQRLASSGFEDYLKIMVDESDPRCTNRKQTEHETNLPSTTSIWQCYHYDRYHHLESFCCVQNGVFLGGVQNGVSFRPCLGSRWVKRHRTKDLDKRNDLRVPTPPASCAEKTINN